LLAVQNLDRDSSVLRQIRHALARIANGTYGVCLHCEENILPKRMAVGEGAGQEESNGERLIEPVAKIIFFQGCPEQPFVCVIKPRDIVIQLRRFAPIAKAEAESISTASY
jgi:hypothetical protein